MSLPLISCKPPLLSAAEHPEKTKTKKSKGGVRGRPPFISFRALLLDQPTTDPPHNNKVEPPPCQSPRGRPWPLGGSAGDLFPPGLYVQHSACTYEGTHRSNLLYIGHASHTVYIYFPFLLRTGGGPTTTVLVVQPVEDTGKQASKGGKKGKQSMKEEGMCLSVGTLRTAGPCGTAFLLLPLSHPGTVSVFMHSTSAGQDG